MKVFKLYFPKRGRFLFFDFIIEPKNENLYCGAEYMTVLAPVASAKDSFKFHIVFCLQELYVIELKVRTFYQELYYFFLLE